jgi:hypothetical protein
MARLLNELLGRAYSYRALLKESAPFLNNPKLPAGLPAAMSHFDDPKQTFLEFVQLSFKDHLKQIAEKRTKAEQRVELLSIRLEELSWNALNLAAKDVKYVQSWDHLVAKGIVWFEAHPKADWGRQLIGRFMAASLIGAWLAGIGRKLYQLEDHIESALELHESYDAEIKTLDVSISEIMFDKLSKHEDEEGRKIARLKDEVIRPLINEQYAVLDKLAADIKANAIDVNFYKTQFARINGIKQYIALTISASAIPN